jgi:plasmid maintenance system antidote protein VapI
MSRPVNRMRPVHPGEVLREDYLIPLEMSVNALALALAVPSTRLALQADYDLKTLPTRAEIERRVHPRSELADV